MDQFLRRKNVQRFRLLVEEIIADEAEWERNLKLVAKELQQQQDAERLWTEALHQSAASANIRDREP